MLWRISGIPLTCKNWGRLPKDRALELGQGRGQFRHREQVCQVTDVGNLMRVSPGQNWEPDMVQELHVFMDGPTPGVAAPSLRKKETEMMIIVMKLIVNIY